MNQWRTEKLAKLTSKVGSGSTPRGGKDSYHTSGVPLIRSMNVHFDGFRYDGLAYLNDEQANSLRTVEVRGGDVLLNITGASIGRVTIAPTVMNGSRVNQHVCIIRPVEFLDSSFLRWYLASPEIQDFILTMQSGATRQALTKEKILDFDVPVPPLDQQKYIVAEIEKQFSRLDEAVANLKRVKANLKRYKAAVLKAAVEGRLVETEAELARREGRNYETGTQLLQRILETRRSQWKGKGKYKEPAAPDTTNLPELPEGWVWASIEQLAYVDVGFAFKSNEFAAEGIRLLRGENIEPGRLRWTDTRFWPTDKLDAFRWLLVQEGEIILAMDRPIVSAGLKLARVSRADLPCLLVQRVARMRCVSRNVESYLFATMQTHRFEQHLLGGQTGTQLPHVSGSNIAAFVLPFPPLDEQARIVSEAERRLSIIGETTAQVDANLQRAERMRQAVLQTAFRGSLPN